MKRLFLSLIAVALVAGNAAAEDSGVYTPIFHATDTLAARDEYGKLHQMPDLYPPDYEARLPWRPLYYLQSGTALCRQPAYVGALQAALRRLGYYCGPIDGVYTDAVSEAISHMQKNYSMHVTGTLTVPVRRALHLP